MSLQRIFSPLWRRINTLVGRGVLQGAQSAPDCQTMQVTILADEVMDDVEHMEPYGYTSNPPSGAEGVILNVAGQRGACVGINFGNRAYRLRGLKTGEVALYTDEGDKVELLRDRKMRLTTLHLTIDAQEDVIVNTKAYTVNASEGVTYQTPAFGLGGVGGCTATMAANMRLRGDVDQQGGIVSSGDQVAQGKSTAHHTHPGDSGGVTGEPQ